MAIGYSVLKEKVKEARKLGFKKIIGCYRWECKVALGGNRFASISLTNNDIANIDNLEALYGALVEEVKANPEKYSYKRFY
ncbi:hypothetical protein [Parageobacillus thermoglucosidasius]|uniref:hypothetical protein n=1 Tax=Parageobacillus thermoglucosidasius TaxID=1426 RepID=UPI002E1AC91D|nr:hypothetical protein [Parageobacillus thermoglucosidasius]MED4946483.1 hypothetical protein [Parageobacillus thermoglucosidasius]MED4984044.1 hypothetical protein [Parageobacillus thermoglucosidasius]